MLVPLSIALVLVGSQLGVIETRYQPMKIAAAEAQWETCQPCSFSAFQIGGGNRDEDPTKVIAIPHLLSILATLTWNGQVVGLNELQAQYEQQYGPGNYVPNVFIQYWSMRVMAYLATAIVLLVAVGRVAAATGAGWTTSKWFLRVAIWAVFTPFIMNTAGWMLTENGRQPWIVQGLMKTADGVSPSVSATEIWISLAVFAALYVALGVDRARPDAALRPARAARRATETARTRPGPDLLTCRSRPSGSSSSRSSGPGSSSWRASTSASACCTRSSAATSASGGPRSTPSGRSGTATRSG